jgi:hypothetical protein
MAPMQAVEAGVEQLREVAPVLAAVAAAVGWMARRGGRAGLWQLLGDMRRGRSRIPRRIRTQGLQTRCGANGSSDGGWWWDEHGTFVDLEA